nr:uncharacterized protein LOC105494756 [Macaca nemestrina]
MQLHTPREHLDPIPGMNGSRPVPPPPTVIQVKGGGGNEGGGLSPKVGRWAGRRFPRLASDAPCARPWRPRSGPGGPALRAGTRTQWRPQLPAAGPGPGQADPRRPGVGGPLRPSGNREIVLKSREAENVLIIYAESCVLKFRFPISQLHSNCSRSPHSVPARPAGPSKPQEAVR